MKGGKKKFKWYLKSEQTDRPTHGHTDEYHISHITYHIESIFLRNRGSLVDVFFVQVRAGLTTSVDLWAMALSPHTHSQVLYCTVLYCTVLYWGILSFGGGY